MDSGMDTYELFFIMKGHCSTTEENYSTTCTCTLIRGKYNVIVNALSYWERWTVLKALSTFGIGVNEIHYVVSTHARPDYFGNNNLFRNSTHIVGHSISRKMSYEKSPLSLGHSYNIDEDRLKVIPTPGYTLTDLTVVVKTLKGKVYITGELFQEPETLFERENSDLNLYTKMRRIEYPIFWRFNRNMVMSAADYIVPGHGDIIEVTEQTRRNFFKIYYNPVNRKRRRTNESK